MARSWLLLGVPSQFAAIELEQGDVSARASEAHCALGQGLATASQLSAIWLGQGSGCSPTSAANAAAGGGVHIYGIIGSPTTMEVQGRVLSPSLRGVVGVGAVCVGVSSVQAQRQGGGVLCIRAPSTLFITSIQSAGRLLFIRFLNLLFTKIQLLFEQVKGGQS